MARRDMRSYTDEFRQAAVKRLQAGELANVVGKELDISPSLLRRWKQTIESGHGFTERKSYDDAFKRAAVARLGNETRSAICEDLGIHPSMLSNWKDMVEKGKGRPHRPVKKKAPDRRTYTEAFKYKAIVRVQKGEPQMKVAKQLGISSGMLSNWVHGKTGKHKGNGTKKNYYVKVKDRGLPAPLFGKSDDAPDPARRALAIQSCISMLKRLKPKLNTDDPVHLTAAVVLATLEGKM